MLPKLTKTISLMLFLGLVTLSSCTANRSTQPAANNSPAAPPAATDTAKPRDSEPPKPPVPAGDLRVGEASGSYTAKGETVTLKYAYAGRAQRFGSESIVILLTDREIPAEALAEEIKDQTMLLDGKIRGLEYAIMKDGFWVRFHPGQYQESKSGTPKDYVVENDTVKGRDEDETEMASGKYSRSVKFFAAIK